MVSVKHFPYGVPLQQSGGFILLISTLSTGWIFVRQKKCISYRATIQVSKLSLFWFLVVEEPPDKYFVFYENNWSKWPNILQYSAAIMRLCLNVSKTRYTFYNKSIPHLIKCLNYSQNELNSLFKFDSQLLRSSTMRQ